MCFSSARSDCALENGKEEPHQRQPSSVENTFARTMLASLREGESSAILPTSLREGESSAIFCCAIHVSRTMTGVSR